MRRRRRLERIVRQFVENGLRVLLEDPGNVRELMQILEIDLTARIDFDQMRVEPVRFVQRDFRHLESDIVLQAPLRPVPGMPRRRVVVYVLIEHQTEPDAFMIFRVLEYVVLIYRRQMREWLRQHGSLDGLRLQPVLPIVFYTGSRTWPSLGSVAGLVEMGEELADLVPSLGPFFLNLAQTESELLAGRGGAFGQLLRLVRQKHWRQPVFAATLREVVRVLEGLATREEGRWRDLLSYLHALVYNARDPEEHAPLHQQIEASVEDVQRRQEVSGMAKTIAEMFIEQGMERGRREEAVRSRQQTLLTLLRAKFGRIPAKHVQRMEATDDVARLDAWIKAFATAEKLDDIPILTAE